MTTLKLKWVVEKADTGRFGWLNKRGWPSAYYPGEAKIAATIVCEDPYVPARVREGNHGPLAVRIADYSKTPWEWKTLAKRFATLEEAKLGALDALTRNESFQPVKKAEPTPPSCEPYETSIGDFRVRHKLDVEGDLRIDSTLNHASAWLNRQDAVRLIKHLEKVFEFTEEELNDVK